MTLTVVQISDTHLSAAAPQRMADLEQCIRVINALPTKPDLVVHTGDISHDGLLEEYHSARELLDELQAPYHVMAGNRDDRATLQSVFCAEQTPLPQEGWIQYSLEQYPVRLLMVDTVCDHSNKGELCSERLSHLETMLSADTTKPTALFLHHTPFEATGIPDPYQFENWHEVFKLAELLSQYDNLIGMYCGHVHRFIDGNISGIPARALSCLAGDLRKGEVTDEERTQPVYRVLSFPG